MSRKAKLIVALILVFIFCAVVSLIEVISKANFKTSKIQVPQISVLQKMMTGKQKDDGVVKKAEVSKSKKETTENKRSSASSEMGGRWVWTSYQKNGERNVFQVRFIEKNNSIIRLALYYSGVEFSRVAMNQLGPSANWLWSGEWDNPVNNNNGCIILEEVVGSNGEKYRGYVTHGKMSNVFDIPVTIEFRR